MCGVCVDVWGGVDVWGVLTLSHAAAQYCVAVAIQKPLCFSNVLVVNNTMFKGIFIDSQLCRVETFPCNAENVYSALYPDNWLCPGERECVGCVLMCWCIFFNAFTVY